MGVCRSERKTARLGVAGATASWSSSDSDRLRVIRAQRAGVTFVSCRVPKQRGLLKRSRSGKSLLLLSYRPSVLGP